MNRRIERLGGEFVRQRGSHRRYAAIAADGTKYFTTVLQHTGDLKTGTLRGIENDLVPAFGEGWLR